MQINDCKQFIDDFIPYKDLKKVGFFRHIKHNEYQKIVERFLTFLGMESMEDYKIQFPSIKGDEFTNVSSRSYVNRKGEFVEGISGHISF